MDIHVLMACAQGEYDKALKLAKFAVNTTPSEFLTWAKLTDGKLSEMTSRVILMIWHFYSLH